ncbi:hypothetical protein [Marinobacter phage PS6]|uniref:Acb2/Tad1 domain-containing protein n=1 Tax=Marinobacter sp. DS40M6 TaxID=1597776 RepID=UPI000C0C4956|nr:hypothetical protein [Marinobacter sp. DS40M6]ATN93253.1 hypothetical protein [Marinobacter phage PS6]MDC8457832.1 hypothetical protein [Marinobacter sp. DS40M6]
MENQHRKITGYRELDEAEIGMMNEIKAAGAELEDLVERLERTTVIIDGHNTNEPLFDQRWVSEGKMDLQKGIMSLVRSVAKPGSF